MTDENSKQGRLYYWLKQADYNSTLTYSSIRAVEFRSKQENIFTIYPNPVANIFTIVGEDMDSATNKIFFFIFFG